jgi:hypothetical protein
MPRNRKVKPLAYAEQELSQDGLNRIQELREVLLVECLDYGVAVDASAGDLSLVAGWRDWIEWVRDGFLRKVAQAEEFQSVAEDGTPLQEWSDVVGEGLDGMQEFLRAFAERDGEAVPDSVIDGWRSSLPGRLERLAGYARSIEILPAEPLGEFYGQGSDEIGESAGVALLGALEDSISLMAYGSDEDRELCASGGEMYRLLRWARETGVWQFLDPSRPVPARAVIELKGPSSQEVLPHAKEVRGELIQMWSQLLIFYLELAPDRRELSEDEHEAVRESLRLGAVCLRRVARRRGILDLLAARGLVGMSVGRTIAVMRFAQRSLVLALSDDPAVRKRAITPSELAALNVPVRDYWQASRARRPPARRDA